MRGVRGRSSRCGGIVGVMSTKTVTNLEGHWPQWYGMLGMQFVYVRVRYGQSYIGVGNSRLEAERKSELFREDESLCGVAGMREAVEELSRAGFTVESVVVPSHLQL